MNYRKVYIKIISNAKLEETQGLRSKKNGYYEKHHILPKSLFPLWKSRKSNLVLLTAREHYFCHQLLTKIYNNGKMIHALWFLTIHNKTLDFSSRDYARIREKFSEHQSRKLKGCISYNKGKKMSEETRKNYLKLIKEIQLGIKENIIFILLKLLRRLRKLGKSKL